MFRQPAALSAPKNVPVGGEERWRADAILLNTVYLLRAVGRVFNQRQDRYDLQPAEVTFHLALSPSERNNPSISPES